MTAGGSAIERARALLDERFRETPDEAGYLDLLGDQPPRTSGPAEALMRGRVVPAIYERAWRPLLSRAAKGLAGPGMDEEVRIARLMLSLSHGHQVLDVACGPGNFTREFATAIGAEGLAVGIDASQTMLERAADMVAVRRVDNLALVRGDAVNLPFVDDAFDAVCCFGALYLFDDPMRALDEMARVLRPGGRIALMASVRRQLTLPQLKPVVKWLSGVRVFEREELIEALDARGFGEIHQRIAGLVQFVGGRLR